MGRVILRTRSRVLSYVVQIGAKTHIDARVELSGAFMLTCNKITRLIYENYRCLTKFAEVIVARQAVLWVHYIKSHRALSFLEINGPSADTEELWPAQHLFMTLISTIISYPYILIKMVACLKLGPKQLEIRHRQLISGILTDMISSDQ